MSSPLSVWAMSVELAYDDIHIETLWLTMILGGSTVQLPSTQILHMAHCLSSAALEYTHGALSPAHDETEERETHRETILIKLP